MKLRRHRHNSVPALQMAAMPDLIFTILFFFMIVTHMRENTVQVSYKQPEAQNLTKVTNKAAVINVYVGKDFKTGEYQVQVANTVVPLSAIAKQLRKEREHIPSDQLQQIQASLHADRNVPMSVVNKVKIAMRDAHILKINYSAIDNEAVSRPTE